MIVYHIKDDEPMVGAACGFQNVILFVYARTLRFFIRWVVSRSNLHTCMLYEDMVERCLKGKMGRCQIES
jgi:hypothetical protein